jgi:predicted GNAT family acetyltransferase
MERVVRDNRERRRYEILSEGRVVGSLTYRLRGEVVSFQHTEVDNAYSGNGFASSLVRRALDETRQAGRLVLPYCPYVRGWIEKHPDYVDLVPADKRPAVGFA